MTGPEHYQAAIDMLNQVGVEQKQGKTVTMSDAIAVAQVQATLALAAATALAASGLMAGADFSAWKKACSVQPERVLGPPV